MYLVAVFLAKLLSPFVLVFAIAAQIFSSKLLHIALWGVAYVIFTEVSLHSMQASRQTELIPMIAAALAFAVAYGVVFSVARLVTLIKSKRE